MSEFSFNRLYERIGIRLFIFGAVLFVSGIAIAQPVPDTVWTSYLLNPYNGGDLLELEYTRDGGCIGVGSVILNQIIAANVWRFNRDGDTLWTRRYGTELFVVRELMNGEFIIGGKSPTAFYAKLDSEGDTLWTRTIGTSNGNEVSYISLVNDGGYILTGTRRGSGGAGDQILIARTDGEGNILWTHLYGAQSADRGEVVWQSLDGNFMLLGVYNNRLVLMKFSAEGDTIRTRDIESSWLFRKAIPSQNDGMIIMRSYDPDQQNPYISICTLFIDSLGNIIDSSHFSDPSLSSVIPYEIKHANNNEYIILGRGISWFNRYENFLARCNSLGQPIWTTATNDTSPYNELLVSPISSGGYFIYGRTYSAPFLMKTGLDARAYLRGQVIGLTGLPIKNVMVRSNFWPHFALSDSLGNYSLRLQPGYLDIQFEGANCDTYFTFVDIVEDINNLDAVLQDAPGLLNIDTIQSLNAARIDTVELTIANPNSECTVDYVLHENVSWVTISPSIGTLQNGETDSISVILNGTFLERGRVYSTTIQITYSTNTSIDTIPVIYHIALDALSNPPIIQEFALSQNYPNPFNSSTEIRYELAKEGRVKLSVYDILGREVRELTNEVQSAGEHRVVFEGKDLASGIYFARIKVSSGQIGGSASARIVKMVMLK